VKLNLVYSSNFKDPAALSGWVLYNGVPSCCPSARWAKSQVVLEDGLLVLKNTLQPDGTYLSGGISMARLLSQTYGRWRVKFRFDGGVGIKMVALLWQQDPVTVPGDHAYEIDFVESKSSDAGRTNISATLHHPPGNGMVQLHLIDVDPAPSLEDWHTWTVTWEPGRIAYALDGKNWGVSLDPTRVPAIPMHFGIQTTSGLSNGGGAMPDATTPPEVDLQIDHIKIWSYTP
jgi:beta-glucanase (GH16 family)